MIETPLNESLSDQTKNRSTELRVELVQHLENFAVENNLDLRELIKDISKKQNISLRGLEKIISAQVVTPSAETQIKVYSYIYKTDTLIELLTKVPEIVAKNIQSTFTGTKTSNNSDIITLTKNTTFKSIYHLTAGDIKISLSTIKDEFGRQGLKMVETMIGLDIITLDQNENLVRKNNLLTCKEIRKNFINYMVNDLYQTDKNINVGDNFSGIVLGDTTEEEYDEIYTEIKNFLNHLRDRVQKSKPTKNNFKKIAIGMIMDEYKFSNTSEENKLC